MPEQTALREVTTMNNKEVKNGTPDFHRNDKYELDTYVWPDGRWVRVHDDGRMTSGRDDHTVESVKIRNFRRGNKPGCQVVATFTEITS
jgi:hypothetical protein